MEIKEVQRWRSNAVRDSRYGLIISLPAEDCAFGKFFSNGGVDRKNPDGFNGGSSHEVYFT